MRKSKVVIGILAMAGMLFSLQPAQASASECGNWIVSATGNSRCDTSDGCGFLWLNDTQKHDEAQYRLCTSIAGNEVTITRETRVVTVKDGCC